MKQFIVSANYLDRDSKNPWLIRGEDEKLEKVIPYMWVKATGVEFVRSSEEEAGFGCRLVARCNTAKGYNKSQNFDTTGLRRIKFDYFYFVDAETGKKVDNVETLHLDSEGHMFAEIAVPISE
jgi:hypothetical protein